MCVELEETFAQVAVGIAQPGYLVQRYSDKLHGFQSGLNFICQGVARMAESYWDSGRREFLKFLVYSKDMGTLTSRASPIRPVTFRRGAVAVSSTLLLPCALPREDSWRSWSTWRC